MNPCDSDSKCCITYQTCLVLVMLLQSNSTCCSITALRQHYSASLFKDPKFLFCSAKGFC